MKKQMLFAALTAMLLTGCASESLVNTNTSTTAPLPPSGASTETGIGEVTAPQTGTVPFETVPLMTTAGDASGTVSDTSAVTEITEAAGDSPNFVIVPAPAVTYATTAATKPAATTTAKPNYNLRFTLPVSAGDLFVVQGSEELAGTGLVHAKDGLRLRDRPSAKGKQLATLKDGETVEILGVEPPQDLGENDPISDMIYSDSRWYHVKAGGKEGYANGKYIAVQFKQKLSELSRRQLRAMATYLYCQAQDLYIVFARDGGFKGRGQNSADSFSNDQGLYEQVQPSTVKLSDIYNEFYQYFSKTIHKDELSPKAADKAKYYTEKNGKLYVNTTFGDNVWFLDGRLNQIVSAEETQVNCTAWYNYTPSYRNDQNEGYEETKFSLVYEDGVWKVGEFSPVY